MLSLPFDHVAVAVPSIADALPIYELVTGARGSPPEAVEPQGVRVAFVGSVELLEPLGPDSPIAGFLERRGAGLHHVAFRVQNLEAEMARLKNEGLRFTAEEPRTGRGGHRVAFLHPKSTGGVLIELLQH